MWGIVGRVAAGLLCLLLLWAGVSSLVTDSGAALYDAKGPDVVGASRFISAETVRRSEAYTDMIRRQDLDGLRAQTDPAILDDAFYKAVPVIAHLATDEKPKSVRILGYHINKVISTGAGSWTDTQVTLGHYYPWGIIFTSIVLREQNQSSRVISYNLRRLTNADIASVKFSLVGKLLIHYAMLALAGAILLFSLSTLYVALTRPRLRFRWLWVLPIALGVGHFSFNWGTAQIGLDFMSFFAPQASLSQGIAEYPVLHFWLPVGATLFWFLARYKPVPVPVAHPEG